MFKSGRPRKFCFGCQPKPEPRPRKPYTPRVELVARCGNPRCGAEFSATYSRQKFCSAACRNGVNNIAGQERRRDRCERSCGECGSAFAPGYGDRRQKYCSIDCRTKHEYRQSAGSTHRRRAKKHGGAYVEFKKIEVFERDGWLCRLCGIATPREKQGLRVHDAPELDHIVPLAVGGDHSKDNTQCLCRSCNALKGARTMQQVRAWLAG